MGRRPRGFPEPQWAGSCLQRGVQRHVYAAGAGDYHGGGADHLCDSFGGVRGGADPLRWTALSRGERYANVYEYVL